MRVTFRLSIGVVLLVSAVTLAAQGPRGGAADGEPVLIRGVVIGAESGAPLRRARIATSRDLVPAVFSGEDGRFELRAPRSSLRVTKPGHVPLTVDRADVPQDGSLLTVPLVPGGVLTGTVFETTGAPAVGARVRVRSVPVEGGRGGAQFQTDTDDRGLFRVGNLPAGRYAVEAGSTTGRGGRGRRGAGAATGPGEMSADLRPGSETAVSLVLAPTDPPAPPQRPPPLASPRDAGTVRGRVASPDGNPVERASVSVLPVNAQNGSSRTTTTDATGLYELTGVPAGEYRVRASRAGFPPVEYGQRTALQQGRIVRIQPGARVQGIDVVLPRGSAVSGSIVDAWGEPMEGVDITVLQVQHADGRVRLMPASGVRSRPTDDRGAYRLYGLLPGAYYVLASERASGRGGATQGAAQAGRGLPARLAELLGGRGSPATLDLFYPGTPRVTEAISLAVSPGQDVVGLDMVFAPQPGTTVSGTALGSRGAPLRGRAVLGVSARYGAPLLPLRTAGLDAQGRFEFTDVAPGDYVVQVSGIDTDTVASARAALDEAAGGRRGRGGRGGGRGGGGATNDVVQRALSTREFGVEFVSVSTGQVSDVLVQTSVGSTVTGRIELEGDSNAVQLAGFGLSVRPADPDLASLTGETPPRTAAGADGTFTLSGLTGPSRFVATQAPAGWWLKSVEVGGVNAVLDPATFGRPDQSAVGVVATFASGAGRIDGYVVDERQERVSEFAVIVFPANQDRWFPGSPYVTMATAAQDGAFAVPRLPPGEYVAVAVERVEGSATDGAWRRPEMLGGLAPFGQRIHVRQGQQITAELKLVRLAM